MSDFLAVKQVPDTVMVVDADGNPVTFGAGSGSVAEVTAIAAIVGNITANGQSVVVKCDTYNMVMLHCSGTFAGSNVNFEASLDSTNGIDGAWVTIEARRTVGNVVEASSGVIGGAPGYAWRIAVSGYKYIKIRATAFTSGTQVWTIRPTIAYSDPAPASQITGTQPVSGSLTVTPATPSAFTLNSAVGTNATSVKNSASTVYGITAFNHGSAVAYLKLHNLASAPTVGTSAVVLPIAVPAKSTVQINWGPLGMRFNTGLALSMTVGEADTDTAGMTTGQMKVNISYI